MKLTEFGLVRSNERMHFLEKTSNVLDLTRFPNEEEAKAKVEFGLYQMLLTQWTQPQKNLHSQNRHLTTHEMKLT